MILKVIKTILNILAVVFVFMSILALVKKGDSVYSNQSEQRNPLEGKKVVFISNDNEPENADGVRGHLKAIGNSENRSGVYEKYIKRILDIILSFGGLVAIAI